MPSSANRLYGIRQSDHHGRQHPDRDHWCIGPVPGHRDWCIVSRSRWQRKAPDFYWKQGDTAPAIAEQLFDGLGVAVNLTAASVKFMMWGQGAAAIEVNAAATITDAALGKVSYTPIATDTDTPGDYLVEWAVTFGGGAIETFPNSGWQKVRVVDDIAA